MATASKTANTKIRYPGAPSGHSGHVIGTLVDVGRDRVKHGGVLDTKVRTRDRQDTPALQRADKFLRTFIVKLTIFHLIRFCVSTLYMCTQSTYHTWTINVIAKIYVMFNML